MAWITMKAVARSQERWKAWRKMGAVVQTQERAIAWMNMKAVGTVPGEIKNVEEDGSRGADTGRIDSVDKIKSSGSVPVETDSVGEHESGGTVLGEINSVEEGVSSDTIPERSIAWIKMKPVVPSQVRLTAQRKIRRGSRGGEMGEFPPPFFLCFFFLIPQILK